MQWLPCEHDQLRLVLDCGNGVFGKLRSVADYRSVADVLISHLHADHFLDLIPFSYALANADRLGQLSTAGRPRVLDLPARTAGGRCAPDRGGGARRS